MGNQFLFVLAGSKQQIPQGNDRKKSKGKYNSRFPSGMTERKAKNERKKSKGKCNSRFPSGMIERSKK